jgi:hypothetical protein
LFLIIHITGGSGKADPHILEDVCSAIYDKLKFVGLLLLNDEHRLAKTDASKPGKELLGVNELESKRVDQFGPLR